MVYEAIIRSQRRNVLIVRRLRSGAKEVGSVWFAIPALSAKTKGMDDVVVPRGINRVGGDSLSPRPVGGQGTGCLVVGATTGRKPRKKSRACRPHKKGIRRVRTRLTTASGKKGKEQAGPPRAVETVSPPRWVRRRDRVIAVIAKTLRGHATSVAVLGESERRVRINAANANRCGRRGQRKKGPKEVEAISARLAKELQARARSVKLEFGTKILKEWRRCTKKDVTERIYPTDPTVVINRLEKRADSRWLHPRLLLFDNRLGVKKNLLA